MQVAKRLLFSILWGVAGGFLVGLAIALKLLPSVVFLAVRASITRESKPDFEALNPVFDAVMYVSGVICFFASWFGYLPGTKRFQSKTKKTSAVPPIPTGQ